MLVLSLAATLLDVDSFPSLPQSFLQNLMSQQGQQQQLQQQLNAAANPNLAMLMAANAAGLQQQQQQQMNNQTLNVNQFAGLQQAYPMVRVVLRDALSASLNTSALLYDSSNSSRVSPHSLPRATLNKTCCKL